MFGFFWFFGFLFGNFTTTQKLPRSSKIVFLIGTATTLAIFRAVKRLCLAGVERRSAAADAVVQRGMFGGYANGVFFVSRSFNNPHFKNIYFCFVFSSHSGVSARDAAARAAQQRWGGSGRKLGGKTASGPAMSP
jgi:hypothetical protein